MKSVVENQAPAVKAERHQDSDFWLEMFALFIHDIESPLASMKYLLKIADEGKLSLQKPTHQRLVRSSKIAVERAEAILYDIMAVAKSGKAGLPVMLTELDPIDIVKESIALAEASAEENGITIRSDVGTGGWDVVADPTLLKRTMDNLLFNAIRHTPRGGTISVYVKCADESLYISVKDSGDGLGDIPPDQLFEKYGQIQLRAAGRHRGVGLGLYFCRLAATGMGGTVFADDHPEGGAVFTLRLRRTENRKPAAQKQDDVLVEDSTS